MSLCPDNGLVPVDALLKTRLRWLGWELQKYTYYVCRRADGTQYFKLVYRYRWS